MVRKLLITLALVLLASGAQAYEPDEWVSSSTVNADAAEFTPTTGAGYLYNAVVQTDGTNDVTVELRDGDSGTTNKEIIPKGYVVTTSSEERKEWLRFDPPATFNGLYGTASSAGNYTITTFYTKRKP